MIKYFDASWKEIDPSNAMYAVELEHDANGLVTSSKTYIANKSNKATISFKQQTFAIIAFDYSKDKTIVDLGKQFPDDKKDFHITLAFIGDVSDIPVEALKSKLEEFAKTQAPIAGKFNGYALFEDTGDGIPLVLLYDSPQLPFLRESLREHFGDLIPEQEHGFTPHCTLAYLHEPMELDFMPFDKDFDAISLWYGDEHYSFPLTGTEVLKGGAGSGFEGHSGRPGLVGGSVADSSGRQDYINQRLWADLGIKTSVLIVSDASKLPQPKTGTIRVYHGTRTRNIQSILDNGVMTGANAGYGERLPLVLGVINKPSEFGDISVALDIPKLDVHMVNDAWVEIHRNISTYEIVGIVLTKLPADDIAKLVQYYRDYDTGVLKQLPIDETSKQRLVDARINIYNSDVDILSEKMFTGSVTLGQWEESMKRLIRELHTSVAAIYKGGWDQMTWEDWGRLGPVLKEQYKYLHGFAQAISDNRDTISLRAIQARAHMYGDAAMQSAGKAITHISIQEQLPWMPREGTGVGMGKGQGTSCLVHCCCGWTMTKMGKEKDFNIVQAVWTLSPAEHCDTCIERKGHTEMLRVYKDIDIPDHIGFYCSEAKELNVLKGGPGSGFEGHPGGIGGKGNPGGSQSIGSGVSGKGSLPNTEKRDYVLITKDPVKEELAKTMKPIYSSVVKLQKSLDLHQPVSGHNYMDARGYEFRRGDESGVTIKLVDPRDSMQRNMSDKLNEIEIGKIQKRSSEYYKPADNSPWHWMYGTSILVNTTGNAYRTYARQLEKIYNFLSVSGLTSTKYGTYSTLWTKINL